MTTQVSSGILSGLRRVPGTSLPQEKLSRSNVLTSFEIETKIDEILKRSELSKNGEDLEMVLEFGEPEAAVDHDLSTPGKKSRIASFLVLNFVLAPTAIFAVCMLLGVALSAAEGWTIFNSFLFLAQDIAGIANPFFNPKDKLTVFGEIMEITISIIALTAAGTIMGLATLLTLASELPDKLGIVKNFPRGMSLLLFGVPSVTCLLCLVLGAILAGVEDDWTVRQGKSPWSLTAA